MKWEGCGRIWNLMYHPGIFLEGLRKTTKSLTENSWSLAQDRTKNLPKMKKEC
jgi:hypothetical protein